MGGPGRPKWQAMAQRAMNLRVEFDVIWAPLSDTANKIGRRFAILSWRA